MKQDRTFTGQIYVQLVLVSINLDEVLTIRTKMRLQPRRQTFGELKCQGRSVVT